MDTSSITAIDLGSNSYRVLKYDCNNNRTLGEFETSVGLADGLSQTGKISNEAVQRVISAIKLSKTKIDFVANNTVAVTTEAMRQANNSKEVIEKIKAATGISFTIIDSKKEAELTLLAINEALRREGIKDENFFLLDIGGGSTELVIHSKEKAVSKSFPYGIVTLSQSQEKSLGFEKFRQKVEGFLDKYQGMMKGGIFISTAGTPTTLAALKHGLEYKTYDKSIINGTVLNLDEVMKLKEYLKGLDSVQLQIKVGTGREDYIDTGIMIYLMFYDILQMKRSMVFDDGLREGVAIEFCQNYFNLS